MEEDEGKIDWVDDQHEVDTTEVANVEAEEQNTEVEEFQPEGATSEQTDDTVEADEGDTDTSPDESNAKDEQVDGTEKKRAGKKRTISERMRQLTNQRKAAEAEAKKESDRAERLADKLRQLQGEITYKTEADFNGDTAAYNAYLGRMNIQEALREDKVSQMQEDIQEAQIASQNAAKEAWFSKVDGFSDELPDYNAVMSQSQLNVPESVVNYALQSPVGPKMLYMLAKNPQKAQQLFSLPPHAQVKQTVFLEQHVTGNAPAPTASTPGTTEIKPARNVPAPTASGPKVNRGSSGSGYSTGMSMESYAAMRNKQRNR